MNSLLAVALAVSLSTQVDTVDRPGGIQRKELDYQLEVYKTYWGVELERRLDQLPTDGAVPEYRIPYSGHDYPDKAGGTMNALRKYDAAFNNGRDMATEYERRDVGGHRNRRGDFEEGGGGGGLLGFGILPRLRARRDNTPGWYGHCNGWTAAAIRHAEPVYSVRQNGVLFTPADIKGLLAEVYMYNQSEFLGGVDAVINPAVLHLTLSNWLGRGEHPVGMETAVGEVVINYPIYSFKSVVKKRSDQRADVQTWIKYALNTHYEPQRPTRAHRDMYFHYSLETDGDGNIVAGRYFGDSARIDMLWTPLHPVQGGEKGNERGNPYMDVKEVLALWRRSVPKETREKWLNVDPLEEDAVRLPEEEAAPMDDAPLADATDAAPATDAATEANSEDVAAEVADDAPPAPVADTTVDAAPATDGPSDPAPVSDASAEDDELPPAPPDSDTSDGTSSDETSSDETTTDENTTDDGTTDGAPDAP